MEIKTILYISGIYRMIKRHLNKLAIPNEK